MAIRDARLAEYFIGLFLSLSATIISTRTTFWNGPRRAKIRTWGFRISASAMLLCNLFLLIKWLDTSLSYIAIAAIDIVGTFFGCVVDVSITLVLGLTLTEIVPERLRVWGLAAIVILYPLVIITTLINFGVAVWYDALIIHAAKVAETDPDALVLDPTTVLPIWIGAEESLRIFEGLVYAISSAAMLIISNRILADRLALYSLHISLGLFALGALVQGALDLVLDSTQLASESDPSDATLHFVGQWAYTLLTPLGMHMLAACARRGISPHPTLSIRDALRPRRIWRAIARAYTRSNKCTYVADAETPDWDEPFSADMSGSFPYDDWRGTTYTAYNPGVHVARHSALTEMSELPVEPVEADTALMKPELDAGMERVKDRVELGEDEVPAISEMESPEIGSGEERRGLMDGRRRERRRQRDSEQAEPRRFERQITLHALGER